MWVSLMKTCGGLIRQVRNCCLGWDWIKWLIDNDAYACFGLASIIASLCLGPKLRPFPLPPTVPITAAATNTGYDIYLRITGTPNALSHMQHLVQLYHNYLRDATVTKKVTVLPPHFPSLVPAVPLRPYANDMQYAVQWQPILMQGWLINIHTLLLGYQISTQTLATPNEVAAERTTATSPALLGTMVSLH